MYFSDSVGIEYQDSFSWFDPLLATDTKLFVDPFLIYKDEGDWASAHDELIAYFEDAFKLLAPAWSNPDDQRYQKTISVMTFPEPKEFGLGLVAEGKGGAGTADGFARKITAAMADAVERGLEDMSHFEELGFLVPGIDRDRISDITCNILKRRFVSYTQQVCRELEIPMTRVQVASASLDPVRRRRVAEDFELPVNAESGEPILLTPKRFLREFPTLNARDWWDSTGPELRLDFNLDVSQRVNKEEIIEIARKRTDRFREWTQEQEGAPPRPYPVDRDPAGVHDWLHLARDVVSAEPIKFSVADPETLDEFIGLCIRKFRAFVEDQGGWRLLWNDDTLKPKREDSIQLLFKGIIQEYCLLNGVILDREVELGKGPVDFVFSESVTERILLEVKRVSSSKLVDGLEKQLTSYMQSGNCSRGWYLAVRFYDSSSETNKISRLRAKAQEIRGSSKFHLQAEVVDATRKRSASKL